MNKYQIAGIFLIGSQGAMSNPLAIHTVNNGETLMGIAQRYAEYELGPSKKEYFKELLKNNSFITNPNMIHFGQSIILPNYQDLIYKIKKGDTLSGIVDRFKHMAIELNREDHLTKILSINKYITDRHKIIVGDDINLGVHFVTPTYDDFAIYRVKQGEFVTKILKNLYGFSEPKSYIDLIKRLNPKIKDINLIYKDQVLKLPSRAYAQKLINTYVSRNIASVRTNPISKVFLRKLEREIFYMRRIEAKEYVKIFKNIKTIESEADWDELLVSIQAKSIGLNHRSIESFFENINLEFSKTKKFEELEKSLRQFFQIWKAGRGRVIR